MSPIVVLASASPRRAELLSNLGVSFMIMPSAVDEHIEENLDPGKIATQLAQKKAKAVGDTLKADLGLTGKGQLVIIGADTVVSHNGVVFGKPSSKKEAVAMLSILSGKVHEVYTGLALLALPHEEMRICSEMSKVRFRTLEPAEIEAYVDMGEPMDKAGSYAVQGAGSAFVEAVEGSYTNVIGLPIPPLVAGLRAFGVKVLGL